MVAYIRADEGYPALFEGGFRPHVGVKGAHGCGEGERASFQHIAGEDVEYAVAVHDVPLLIAGDDAVGVAVEGEPEIGVLCPDRFGEDLGVQRTAAVVDVRAVEGGGCGMHFRARPLEHFGRDRRSGAAGAVQHDAQPGKSSCAGAYRRDIVLFQGGRGEGRPPPFGVVEPSSCEVAFHSFLPVAGELFRRREKDLQAVVAGGIVGGGHHDAARRARCAGGKSHARGGDDAQVRNVRTRSHRAFRDRAGEIFAARACVPSDDDVPALCSGTQRVSEQHGEPVGEFLPIEAAYAVRAEKFAVFSEIEHTAVYSAPLFLVRKTEGGGRFPCACVLA